MANLFFEDGKWRVNHRINDRQYRRSRSTANRKLAEVRLNDLEVRLFESEVPDRQAPQKDTEGYPHSLIVIIL